MLNGLVPDYHPWYMGTMKTTTEIQPAIRATAGAKPARKDQRSAVTNGKRLFVVRPGDTAWSRRFRDILASILCDLGGYENGLSEAQTQLARRATTLCIACERLEGVAASGVEIDIALYGEIVDRLGRCLQRLGLKRQARDVTPSWSDLAAEIAKEGNGA
jgi:hypothetical protein